MSFWFSKRNSTDVSFHSIRLPGDIGSVSIPSSFSTNWEGDDTIVAIPDSEDVTLRISALSFVKKGNKPDSGKEFVAKRARENSYEYSDDEDKSVASYEEFSEQDGAPLLLKYWEVGTRNTVVILSLTIDRRRHRSRDVRDALNMIPAILNSVRVTKSHMLISSDQKEVSVTEETIEHTPQEVVSFGESDRRWLDDSLAAAHELSVKYGSGGECTPQLLDCLFSRWMSDDDAVESPDSIAYALGAALGTYLVENHGFHWVVVNDELGTEYAVKRDSMICFPIASVVKRIEDGESDFFESIYVMVVENLRQLEST